MSKSIFRKDVFGWTLYDFANTIYSMNIVSLYLKRYIVEELGKDDRYYDIPFAISMLIAALLLPALGAISDHSTKKKLFLFLFTITCCLAVGLMAIVPASMIYMLLVLFVIANFAYEAGQPFYNALLYSVADGERARFISGVGVALGYVGSIVGMIIVLPFVSGSLFTLDIPFLAGWGKVGSFLPTAVLFMIFAIPIFLFVKEKQFAIIDKSSIKKAYKEVWQGLVETKKYPGVRRFLIADYFLEDAVMTVIINIGIYCSIVIGFEEAQTNLFLIVSTASAVIGSFLIGKIAEHWSLKKLIYLIAIGWILSLLLIVFISNTTIIWILGSMVGILLGGLWTVTRPYLGELVPKRDLGRFFGLFSLSGRAAAIVGPLIWTFFVYYGNTERFIGRFLVDLLEITPTNYSKLPYQIGVLSLIILLVVGLVLFIKVPAPEEVRHAE